MYRGNLRVDVNWLSLCDVGGEAYGSVPVGVVPDEVLPEFCSGEAGWDDNSTAGGEGGEEAGNEAVDVEQGHDEQGAIARGEPVGCLDVI